MVTIDPESRVPAQGADLSSCEETGEKIQVQDLTQKVGRISPEGGNKISPLVRTAWEVAGVAGAVFSVLATAAATTGLIALSFAALPVIPATFSVTGIMFAALILPGIGGVASIALTHHFGGLTKEKKAKLQEQLNVLDETIKKRGKTGQDQDSKLTASDEYNMRQGLVIGDGDISEDEKQQVQGIIGKELNQWRAIDDKKSTKSIRGVLSSFLAEPCTPHDNAVGIVSEERYIFKTAFVQKKDGKIKIELEILQLQDASESRIFPERTMIPIRMTLELNPQAPGGYSVGNIQRPRK